MPMISLIMLMISLLIWYCLNRLDMEVKAVTYAEQLALILSNVTKSSQQPVRTIKMEFVSTWSTTPAGAALCVPYICAFVDLRRFAEDVALHENNGQPFPIEDVTKNVIEAYLSPLAMGMEIKCTKKLSRCKLLCNF